MTRMRTRAMSLGLGLSVLAVPAAATISATSAQAATTTTMVTYYATSNVRSAPNLSASVVGTLAANTKVTGTVSGTWFKITSPSKFAGKYISTTILKAASTTSTTTPTKNPGSGTSSSNVYQGGTLASGYTLYSGYNGVKVYIAQKYFGIPTSPMSSTMGPTTTTKVKAFQKSHGLSATGVLDVTTWNTMKTGYPFAIDSWAKSADVMDDAPRDVKVAAEVNFAKAQLGKPYIWGGTGPMGFDCSGLLLQAARAGGMKPTGVSNFTNIRVQSDLSNQMWRDGEFQKGSLSNIQVGDFIYYGGSNGVAHHVSMYVGNNTVINAVGNNVQYSSLSNNFGWGYKLGVNRAIRF